MTCSYGIHRSLSILIILGGSSSLALYAFSNKDIEITDSIQSEVKKDSVVNDIDNINGFPDSIRTDIEERYFHLSESDFAQIAKELDIEVASIKAVVEIEAGKAMRGFWAPGIPVINFDITMFNKYKGKAKSTAGSPNESVPSGLNGYALKEWTELVRARKVNLQGANMGTFWGMFQIGGFNYKICGCESVAEFVERMSYSELEQLQLFAEFLINTGMVEFLRKRDWRGFARRYNGASYAKRGYHTRMANAYEKYSSINI